MLLMAQGAQAQPIQLINFKNWPNVKQGVAYDAENFKWNSLTTVDVAKWRMFSLEAGVAGDAEPNNWKAAIVLSVDLFKVGDYIQFPILDKVVFRPGVWFGAPIDFKHMSDTESSAGFSITALEFKF